jgi:glutamine synthetase
MRLARKAANAHHHAIDRAKGYCYDVKPHMETIRLHADRLEYLVDDKLWPLIKYRELMFVR